MLLTNSLISGAHRRMLAEEIPSPDRVLFGDSVSGGCSGVECILDTPTRVSHNGLPFALS